MKKLLRNLYVKFLDWWRPVYYNRIRRKPSTTLEVHSLKHELRTKVRQNG